MDNQIQALEKQLTALENDPQADLGRKIDVMNELAWLLRDVDPHRALILSEAGYALSQQDDSYQKQLAYSLRNLCVLNSLFFDKHPLALAQANEVLMLAETDTNLQLKAHVLGSIACTYSHLADYAQALTYYLQVIELCGRIGDVGYQSAALNDAGNIYKYTQDYAQALRNYERALHLAETHDIARAQAAILINMGEVLIKQNHFDEAETVLHQSLDLARQRNFIVCQAEALNYLGQVQMGRGNPHQAVTLMQQGVDILADFDNSRPQIGLLMNIARAYQQQGFPAEALAALQQALNMAEIIGDKAGVFQCHQLFSEIYEKKGDYKQALTHHKQFYTIRAEVFNEKADQELKTLQVIHETETAKHEAEMHRLKNEELARAKEAADEARQAAEAANRAKSVFLATMSHELRTPLNSILGFGQILQRDPAVSPAQLDRITLIEQSGRHLLTLINDILDIAKAEAGTIELVTAPFNLPGLINEVSRLVRSSAREKGLVFKAETAGTPGIVIGDARRLRQVLLNLLGNAVKFTDTGRVILRVAALNRSVTPAGQPAVLLRFAVEDTGQGIAPEAIGAIFERFQQVGQHEQKLQGAGLGLAICRGLIELMGGTLHVKSKLGQGSLFWFEISLPEVIDPSEPQVADRRQIIGLEGAAPTVLLVDDDVVNRKVLSDFLNPLGFEIVEASDGAEGLAQAEAALPDAIITDMVMAGMSGLELIRRIRTSPTLREMPVIAASASVFAEDRQQSLTAGSNAFLTKPIMFDELLDQLQHLLNLEWVYNDGPVTPWDSSPDGRILAPPVDEVAHLIGLTRKGDIGALRDRVEQLAEMEEGRYQTFVLKLRRLIRQFAVNDIQAFLQPFADATITAEEDET